uniref:Uncharacterized protein n=1 Tax=Solanum lycopersicum TaxID=4081 RepID=A0A3Q7EGY1_SOLLC
MLLVIDGHNMNSGFVTTSPPKKTIIKRKAKGLSDKDKLEENKRKLEIHVSELLMLATSRSDTMKNSGTGKMLSLRISSPLCKVVGLVQGSGDRDYANGEEVVSSVTARLPFIQNIPPYTTWIFLDKPIIDAIMIILSFLLEMRILFALCSQFFFTKHRNQRMAEDQSVVGRRRIYYDQHGSEALICSDSEEDIAEPEEEKRHFSEGEDKILSMYYNFIECYCSFIKQIFASVSKRKIEHRLFRRVGFDVIYFSMSQLMLSAYIGKVCICHAPSPCDRQRHTTDYPTKQTKPI